MPDRRSDRTMNRLLAMIFALMLLLICVGCGGGGMGTPSQSPVQGNTQPAPPVQPAQPVQPAPVGSKQFSMFGYTWKMHASAAPGGGTFSTANVSVQPDRVVLTLDEDSTGNSTGAEIATVTPLSYGTYTFTYAQDMVQSGSIASGFSYITGSVTEIDVEQQGCYPQRWDFTNWQTTAHKGSSFVDGYDATTYHTISYTWTANRITWTMDGAQVAVHDEFVPSQAVPFLFNFWGTNNSKWGGMATAGTRHMTVVGFSFQPK
jgi:beta-glucanase (GH16 family)